MRGRNIVLYVKVGEERIVVCTMTPGHKMITDT